MTNQEIKTRGELIRDETVTGANTAQRVGEAFVAIGENLEEVKKEISKVNSFSNDYYKEFAVGEVPLFNTTIERFGFGGKAGDTLKVSVVENTWESAVYLALYGKSTESDSWERIFVNYSRVIVSKLLESDYAELGFSLGSTITSATVKASLIDGKPSLLDMLSKVDGYYVCLSASNADKVIDTNWYRLRNGGLIAIKFIYANTKPAPTTLNINGTGAKMIYLNGKPVGLDNTWKENCVCLCWYDSNQSHYELKSLFDGNGDIYDARIKNFEGLYKSLIDFTEITESTTLTSGRKYVVNLTNGYSVGYYTENNAYRYSEPIALLKGEVIKVRSYGNLYCPIQECDSQGNVIARLVVESLDEPSADRDYFYIATKDMYVVVNVQNASGHPYSISKGAGFSMLTNLIGLSQTLFNGKSNYASPKILFTSNDVNVGDVLFYSISTQSDNWNIRLFDENNQKISDAASRANLESGIVCYGRFTIPEGFAYAKSTWSNVNVIIAKQGTVFGDSIGQALQEERLEKAEDIIKKSDLASIGNLLCNGAVNYNGIYFSNDDVNEGDEIFYELIPRGSEFSIKIQYTNGEPETTIISTGAATAGETYRGKFVIPSNFSLAKLTRGNLKYCKMAKAGTIGGDSIAQAIMEEELESIKDDSNLPNYYKDYLDGMEAEIRNLQLDIQGEEDSFIFITDTHWIDNYKQSPAIIESLLKRGLTNKVVFGGDLMALRSDINKATTDETREYIKTQIDFHRKFASTVLACGSKIFNVRGNHDINGIPAASGTSAEMWRANKKATQNILSQTLELTSGIKNFDGINYVYDNDLNKIRFIIFDGNETSYRKKYDSEDEPMPFGASIVNFAQIPWVPNEIMTIRTKFDIEIPSGYTEGNVAVKIYLGTKADGQSEPTWDLNSEQRITSISGEQVLEFSRSDMNKFIGISFGGNFNTARIRLTFAQNDSGEYLANTLNWLATALTGSPANYDVVVLCHYAATVATGSTFIPDFNRLLLAYNAKANTNINNNQYDFSDVQGKILAYISGHTHKNLQSFSVGVTHICTACDATYSENPYMNEKTYSRVQGTVTEQLFDFIQIDKSAHMIYCKRIGGGYDRYFHTQPNTIVNGNSITLQPTMLSDDLTWGCYDNDAWVTKTDETPITSSRVTVSNGVVSAIAVGEAVVYAMDAKGNREFFEVIVE